MRQQQYSRDVLAHAWPWSLALALVVFSAWACLASLRLSERDAVQAARPAVAAMASGSTGVSASKLAL